VPAFHRNPRNELPDEVNIAVKLNRTSFEYAKELVTQEKVVVDERDAWSEDQRSSQEESEFIDAHGYPL
jgi:hypothetical protein